VLNNILSSILLALLILITQNPVLTRSLSHLSFLSILHYSPSSNNDEAYFVLHQSIIIPALSFIHGTYTSFLPPSFKTLTTLLSITFYYPQATKTFFPLFPFLFPFPTSGSSSSTSWLSIGCGPHALAPLLLPPTSLLTIPLPYPKIVLWGLAAGGRAGNASPPIFLLAGLEVGGVGLAEAGLEFCAEDDCGTQDTLLLPVAALLFLEEDRTGKASLGTGLELLESLGEEEEVADALPHDRACETWLRDDCAVEDLSFRTRVLFTPLLDDDPPPPVEEVTAQFKGMLLLFAPAAMGKEG
jgi:hypothetical protein